MTLAERSNWESNAATAAALRDYDEVLAAISILRARANDTEPQVLDFLVRHCGGQQ
jgi:hypothetical protein